MNKHWLILLITALLLTSSMNGVGVAAGIDAVISANQTDELVTVKGKTASDDPEKVPLLITDASGQVIYFREVAGAGSPFAFEFQPPEETARGHAVAKLYSRTPVESSFYLKSVKEDEKKKIDVTVQILGFEGKEIFPKTKLKVTDGSSVFNLLQVAASEGDFDIEYEDSDGDGHDVYIKSIDGLAEFDKGPESGWIYRVNGEGPQAPVDRYLVEPDDEVEFLYTSDLGETEIGDRGDGGPRLSYAKTESVSVDKALHQLRYAQDAEAILEVVENLLLDLANYEIEKQRSYLPEVEAFFQAAFERAAMLEAKKGAEGETVSVSIEAIDVKDLLQEQEELAKGLQEELMNSTLYKPLLGGLRPSLLVLLPEKSDSRSWQLSVSPDAWSRLKEAGARIAVTKGEWRTVLLPVDKVSDGKPLVFRLRFYDDQEQTAQLESMQTVDGSTPVPVGASVGITSSHPQTVRYQFSWPLTGTVESGAWPVLYTRSNSSGVWQPNTTLLTLQGKQIVGEAAAFGDVLTIAVQPVFHDLWQLSAGNEWVKEPVTALASVGVVRGVAPGQFGLHRHVTTGEFKAMLARLDGKEGAQTTADSSIINRAQIALLLVQAYGKSVAVDSSQAAFTDAAAIPRTMQEAVQLVVAKGWMKGRTDGRFDPSSGITRGEAAAVLYRYWKESQIAEKE